MIIGMGADYGPSLALASPAAQAHQKAIGKKPAGKLALKKPTGLVPAAAPEPLYSYPLMVLQQRWPWILGGLGVLGVVVFWLARPKRTRGGYRKEFSRATMRRTKARLGRRRRNPRRPLGRAFA